MSTIIIAVLAVLLIAAVIGLALCRAATRGDRLADDIEAGVDLTGQGRDREDEL